MVEHEGIPGIDVLIRWLEANDADGRQGRANRLQHFLKVLPNPPDGIFFFGGLRSSLYFEEIRRCYLDGSNTAVVLLCLAVVERELAGQLYAAGWDPAKKAPLSAVLEKAYDQGLLSQLEWRNYRQLAKLRNSHAHFRAPLTPTTLTARSVDHDSLPQEVLTADANHALQALASIVTRQSAPST